MKNNTWQLQEAKSKFSELIERVLANGAQVVTRRGKNTVVILPFDEYTRLSLRGQTLSEFLLSSPFAGSELPVDRSREFPREIGIES